MSKIDTALDSNSLSTPPNILHLFININSISRTSILNTYPYQTKHSFSSRAGPMLTKKKKGYGRGGRGLAQNHSEVRIMTEVHIIKKPEIASHLSIRFAIPIRFPIPCQVNIMSKIPMVCDTLPRQHPAPNTYMVCDVLLYQHQVGDALSPQNQGLRPHVCTKG